MNLQQLRERRQEISQKANHLIKEQGDKVWDAARQTEFDAYADDIERLDKQISTTQRLLDKEAEASFSDVQKTDPSDKDAKTRRNLFAKMLRDGPNSLSADEHRQIRNTTGTQTGSQGGYTVQSDIATELIDLLKGYKGMRDVAGSITTTDGAPLSYPTSDGTSEIGEVVAENTTAAAADPVFGTVSLNTFKFGSKSIAIPFELLMDSNIDIVAMVNKRMGDRIGRIENQKFTVGSGTGEPTGLVTAAGVGKTGTTGQTVTVIYDDIVDLIDSVDYAYAAATMKFMFSQTMRKVVRKIKDTQGRPIWIPNYDAGIVGAFQDTLMGYDVQLNNDMPAPAANAKSIAFGDLSKYMIRDAMMLTMFRFDDSAFVLKGQIGFVAWARAGGNLLDTGAVKLYQHSAT